MLDHRDAHDPLAMLVKAIQEDWTSPRGYGENDRHGQGGQIHQTIGLRQETPQACRARQLAVNGIDGETDALWTEVCRWAPRLAGKRECPVWLRDAVMPLPRSAYAELLRESMYRNLAEREYTQAVGAALATVMGRDVRVTFKYAP